MASSWFTFTNPIANDRKEGVGNVFTDNESALLCVTDASNECGLMPDAISTELPCDDEGEASLGGRHSGQYGSGGRGAQSIRRLIDAELCLGTGS